MALQRYNHTLQKFLDQSVNLTTLKAMLLNASAGFNASHTAVTSVTNAGAYEVSGNGWDSGGEPLTLTISTVDTDGAMVDFDNLSITATGGAIGPAYSILIYSGTLPLFFETFASAQEAGEGTPMNVNFNASGLFRVVDA